MLKINYLYVRRICTLFLGVFVYVCANAQMPKWVIAPKYDSLYVKVDKCLLQTDSLGFSILWTMDGKRLFRTEHQIMPFKDGVSVICNKDKNEIVGVVDTSGMFTKFPAVEIAYEHPYFENEYLLCQEKGKYVYFKKDGTKASFPASVRSYPFYNGFAAYMTFDQIEKNKEPYYGYYRTDNGKMKYRTFKNGAEKEMDYKTIRFLSNIGANGKAVAIIRNKLYWFDPSSESFEPLLWGNEEQEKKRHLVLFYDYDEGYFIKQPKDTFKVFAKYGKNQLASLQFDRKLRPAKFVFDGETEIFEESKPLEYKYVSGLSSYAEGKKHGLATISSQVLPTQFEDTGLIYGNKAFVKLNGHWGLIEIIPDLKYSLRLNKGEDVAFRHQKFETQIRLDLPADISAKDARIDVPDSTGCMLDKTSRETKDTESGNFVTYHCVLNIPKSLPDTITTIVYSPVNVSYDGIRLFDVPLSINAWHLKYYNVDPIESETSISNGIASFTININAQKNAGESDYPFEVKIEADSVVVNYEKISETRYKCVVSNLQEGENSLNILITEKGCPPSIFPFEIYYTKPAPTEMKEEEVVIRKKIPAVKKPVLRLEI